MLRKCVKGPNPAHTICPIWNNKAVDIGPGVRPKPSLELWLRVEDRNWKNEWHVTGGRGRRQMLPDTTLRKRSVTSPRKRNVNKARNLDHKSWEFCLYRLLSKQLRIQTGLSVPDSALFLSRQVRCQTTKTTRNCSLTPHLLLADWKLGEEKCQCTRSTVF